MSNLAYVLLALTVTTAWAAPGDTDYPGPDKATERTESNALIDKVEPPKATPDTDHAFQVVYEVFKKGRRTDSSSIIVQATKQGEVTSRTEGGSKQSVFNVAVTPVMGDSVSVDYEIRIVDGKRTFALAKTAAAFKIGSPEKNHFTDSNGDGFELNVKVIRK